jgi:hypothetical protein
MPLLVGFLVEAEGLLAIGFVGHDGFGAALAKPMAQIGTVVGLVAEHLLCCFGAPDQPLRGRTIMRLAAGQKDGKKTAFSICDSVDFRVAPAARASNRLVLFPLFPPEAERCALT